MGGYLEQLLLEEVDIFNKIILCTILVDYIFLNNTHEKILAQDMAKFPDLISLVVQELKINLLCEFIYNLCVKFNEGYNIEKNQIEVNTNPYLGIPNDFIKGLLP